MSMFTSMRMPALCATLMLAISGLGLAASHSDAPLIKQDPQANITDVYAFVGTRYDDPTEKVLNVVVQVRPFSEPGDGVIYDRFADDARYSIHITHPETGAEMIRYDFTFSDVNPLLTPGLKNPDTIISYGLGQEAGAIQNIGDARQNYTQTYTVNRVQGTTTAVLGSGQVPPPNVGLRVTPNYNDSSTGFAVSGATNVNELDSYTRDAIADLSGGLAAFAGPREDGFYADIPGIFDLLDPRIVDNDGDLSDGLGQDGGGIDGFKGFNVLAYALQIPLTELDPQDYIAFPTGPAQGVGVYASVSRQRVTVRRSTGEPVGSGPFVQVNRMGNPLFNEAFVALRDKDRYNRTSPAGDATFESYALNPELAGLVNFVFGLSIPETGRTDLADIFIPDVLRVDTTTDPVRLPGQSGFSRLSFFGGDTVSSPSGPAAGGWPNGRRFGDDVIDIALTALANGPLFIPPLTPVGDNVAANDQIYHQVFPYAATPHAGTANRKDP